MTELATTLSKEDKANCVLGRAVPLIAHEFANCANGILGYSEMLTSTKDEAKRADFSRKLQTYSDRMRRLIDVLRAFGSPPAAGTGTLAHMADDVVDFARCIARPNTTCIKLEIEESLKELQMPPTWRLLLLVLADSLVRSQFTRGRTLVVAFVSPDGAAGGSQQAPLPESELAAQLADAIAHLTANGGQFSFTEVAEEVRAVIRVAPPARQAQPASASA